MERWRTRCRDAGFAEFAVDTAPRPLKQMRIHLLTVLSVACLSAGACNGTTNTGPPPVNISGPWRYSATQFTPTQSSIVGTLTVADQSGTTFDGSLDAVELLPDGTSRRILGPVHGHTLDASTLDFDVILDVSRRHVAIIQADTAAGNWLAGSATTSAAGTFRMVRSR